LTNKAVALPNVAVALSNGWWNCTVVVADTARTLNASKKGKGVKHFGSKKELCADSGL